MGQKLSLHSFRDIFSLPSHTKFGYLAGAPVVFLLKVCKCLEQ
jgi:hypothetical protein